MEACLMTTRQLPEPGEIFLDHVAHFARDLEAAAAAMTRLGFAPTARSVQGNLGADGTLVPAGTANRCAMFRQGYIEILARVSDSPLAQQLDERLSRYVGIHLVAFASADVAAEGVRLAQAGFAPVEPVRLRRQTARGEEARFTVQRVPPDEMPEGRIQFLTHHTEDAVWHKDDLAHPNGAVALEAVHVAVDDPQDVARRWSRFVGRPVRDGVLWLERGRVHFHGRTGAPFAPAPSLPAIVAYEVGVAALRPVRALLAVNQIATCGVGDAVAATAPPALGGVIRFREVGT
jgi:Glyoxalase-like domain